MYLIRVFLVIKIGSTMNETKKILLQYNIILYRIKTQMRQQRE